MELRDNISKRRRAWGLTQEDVASRLGVSRQTVGKWESGKATPELERLIALCDLLGCSLDELVGRIESDCSTESDVTMANENVAGESAGSSIAKTTSPYSPVEEVSSSNGTATKYAAIIAAGVWLVATSVGLLALLFGPSAVNNVEVRRIVPIVVALGVGIGAALVVVAQLYKSRCLATQATDISMARRSRMVASVALAGTIAAVCALVALAPGMRTITFVCIELAALATWPVAFAATLTVAARR